MPIPVRSRRCPSSADARPAPTETGPRAAAAPYAAAVTDIHPPPGDARPSGAATLLPAGPPGSDRHGGQRVAGRRRAGQTAAFRIAAGVVVALLVAAIVIPLSRHGGHRGSRSSAVAARARGNVPEQAQFARSNAALPDATAVQRDTRALLAGSLPAAAVRSSVRDALVHPAVTNASAALGADLALEDPALPACLGSITNGAALFGIDRVSYAGAASLLVVTADGDSSTDAVAYVLGPGCALPGTGIRTVVTVPLRATP